MSKYPSGYNTEQKIEYNEKVAHIEEQGCKQCRSEIKRTSWWTFECKQCGSSYTMVREKSLIPNT